MSRIHTDEATAAQSSSGSEATAAQSSSGSESIILHARYRVLVVDDEPVVLHVLRRVLERRHDVSVASSDAELVQLLEGAPPFDAILCDFGLTADDGTELSLAILRRWPEYASRMAVLTGNVMSACVIRFARTEFVRLIAKPIAAAALFSLVDELAAAPH